MLDIWRSLFGCFCVIIYAFSLIDVIKFTAFVMESNSIALVVRYFLSASSSLYDRLVEAVFKTKTGVRAP